LSVFDFILVPLPAARMTIFNLSDMFKFSGV